MEKNVKKNDSRKSNVDITIKISPFNSISLKIKEKNPKMEYDQPYIIKETTGIKPSFMPLGKNKDISRFVKVEE